MRALLTFALLAIAAIACPTPAHAVTNATFDATLSQIEQLADHAEPDLLTIKLAIDALIAPDTNLPLTRQHLDTLHATIASRILPGASNDAKLALLLDTLYTPGPWNGGRAFAYDLADPLGTRIHNKLLSTYLDTRKGNCVSMPILVAILGQRLGLPVTLATAPMHVFAKYRRDDGTWANIEATSGGYKRDASYQQELAISPLALEQGIYLRPLSRRESAGMMLETVAQHFRDQQAWGRLAGVADLALRFNPRDSVALLRKQSVYAQRTRAYKARYAHPSEFPWFEWQDFVVHAKAYDVIEQQLTALGWVEETPEARAAYERRMQDVSQSTLNR